MLAVNEDMLRNELHKAGLGPSPGSRFGPDGFRWYIRDGSVIVTQSDHDDGVEWIHASIAFADRDPTYEELTVLHRGVFGRRRWAYQVFAPTARHVNIHEHALHLWGRADGTPVLPDFGAAFGSI